MPTALEQFSGYENALHHSRLEWIRKPTILQIRLICQGLQEGDQRCFLVGSKRNTAGQERIKCGGCLDTRVIMIENLIQYKESSIVHVRSAYFHVPQTGHFEFVTISRHTGNMCPAGIIEHRRWSQTIVAIRIVGEQGLRVTTGTFGLKQCIAILFQLRKRLRSRLHPIVLGI